MPISYYICKAIFKSTIVLKTRNIILQIIDFFHPPFARWINQQAFRYLACGGSNQLLNIFLYWFSYNILLQQKDVPLPHLKPIAGPYASLIIASAVTIPIGFLFSKYLVFQESNLKGRVQFFRYISLVALNFVLNYLMLKLFINVLHIYPTVSQTLIIIILAIFSYIVQRFFTFKVKPEEVNSSLSERSN
jgi:putative flippase GtrA